MFLTKAQQYRRLKQEWPTNVVLGRSLIEGLGLFSKRDIEKHTMVIEYKGLIIRNEVANRREKIYDDQRRGCYMFRIDSEQVIDATMHGGLARYINHSITSSSLKRKEVRFRAIAALRAVESG
ncbi:histone-lysine N-methyltransferase trr-like [Oscarella lobularis]|uniref:histone-lysine N-methyltransferase trr-like n=1 Tax=Oscarella lobularis TaxID=121494 RepID=UPI003313A651